MFQGCPVRVESVGRPATGSGHESGALGAPIQSDGRRFFADSTRRSQRCFHVLQFDLSVSSSEARP